MDIGAIESGAQVVLANDIDADSCLTLAENFPEISVEQADVADLIDFPSADILIGGYPCQSFSLGGNRDPEKDPRTKLYLHFVRCLRAVQPQYFVAENVSGLKGVKGGAFFREQIEEFERCGYEVTAKLLNARDYGIPQIRKRLFIVGVHKDLRSKYAFPKATHGSPQDCKRDPALRLFESHGEAIKDLPLWPEGEFYARPHDPDGHMSWYYMSRNRKKPWAEPSFTIVANWRHITLHPASQTMRLVWSNLADGFKQRWAFSGEYEHLGEGLNRPVLEEPRRLSWRECARIQTFPDHFQFTGSVQSRFQQIGNAVPPLLASTILEPLISKKGLADLDDARDADLAYAPDLQYPLW